jgi:hypothetical protein
MTGLDYEYRVHWDFSLEMSEYSRKRPVRLRDREALRAVLVAFDQLVAPRKFSVMFDEIDFPGETDVDLLLDIAPPRIRVLHIQTEGPDTVVVRLTSWSGGQTWVMATTGPYPGRPDQAVLHRLTGLVESVTKPLGWRRIFSKARWRRIQRWSPPVVARSRRDELDARRQTWMVTAFSSVFGFIAGIFGGLVSRG